MQALFNFRVAPGYLIRRAHQRSVALFAAQTATFDLTPVQFAMLNVLAEAPGCDQISLAQRVAFDAATSGSVIGRLEAKGLVRRRADALDRRRKLLWLTPKGRAVLQRIAPAVAKVQDELLAPLTQKERESLIDLLGKLNASGA